MSKRQMTDTEALRLELEITKNTNLACVKRMQQEIDRLSKALAWSEKMRRISDQEISDREDRDRRFEEQMIAQTGGY